MEDNIKQIIQKMTIEEKAALLSGTEFWKTNPIPRLNIPSMYMTDGPCGLRKQGEQADHLGLNQSEETTCFPTSVTVASSWNTENAEKMGEAIAEECHYHGVNMLLGPAVNIKRNPRCGRNFEYYSEDPYLSGEMGIGFVNGVQKKGIGTSVKHFAVNGNENYRFMGDSIVDERALYEIYLRAFERIVKHSEPTSVMSAYNKVNGTYCAENSYLLTDILRKEWGYEGAVISDWGGVADRVKSVLAGMSLEMPGDCAEYRNSIITAAKNKTLPMEVLDREVENILVLLERTKKAEKGRKFDKEAHSALAGKIAKESAVLLKNDGSLPLNMNKKYLVIGDLFEKMRYQGAGSSLINPTKKITPKDAFDQRNINYEFYRGYRESELEPEQQYENLAVAAADNYDEILFFGGQTDYTESEGYDRNNLLLPPNQTSLIKRLTVLNKKIVFVLFGGSPVELPFEKEFNAILNMYLPGQSGGEAAAALLFGEISPSGKLAETWPVSYEEIPFAKEYVSSRFELYKESIYVGYRYFDKMNGKGVRYPFGYGLSYTQFSYSDVKIKKEQGKVIVTCNISNTGSVDGAEVLQLYVKNQNNTVFMPEKELRAFTKVYCKAGETKMAVMTFDREDLSYYHVKEKRWILENGFYQILIGASSADIRLTGELKIEGEKKAVNPYSREELKEYFDVEQLTKVSNATFEKLLGYRLPNLRPKEKPVTMESHFTEFCYSLPGRTLYKTIVGVGKKQYKKALKMQDGPEKEMERKNGMFLMRMMPNNSLRSLSAASAGAFPYHVAKGLVELANWRIFRGLKYIAKKEQAEPLPKEKSGNKGV